MGHEPLVDRYHPVSLHLTVPHCLPVLQSPRGSPPDVWRQLPLEVLRVAQQQVADLSAQLQDDVDEAGGYFFGRHRGLDLQAAKEVQDAAEHCIAAIQPPGAQQLP